MFTLAQLRFLTVSVPVGEKYSQITKISINLFILCAHRRGVGNRGWRGALHMQESDLDGENL
jgi:hypothetical protein